MNTDIALKTQHDHGVLENSESGSNVHNDDAVLVENGTHPQVDDESAPGPESRAIPNKEPILEADEHVNTEGGAESPSKQEDLVAKVYDLEQKLAQLDKMVGTNLFPTQASNKTVDDFDEYGLYDPHEDMAVEEVYFMARAQRKAAEEFGELVSAHNRSARRRRAIKRRQMQTEPEASIGDHEEENTEEMEALSREKMLVSKMLTDGTPATILKTPWDSFKMYSDIDFILNPIQMLVGEPELLFPGFFQTSTKVPDGRKPVSRSLPSKAPEPKTLGGSPLPERVLIHSPEIFKFLSETCDDTYSERKGTVFLRPFKMFDYYEQRIRENAAKLEEIFHRTVNEDAEANLTKSAEATIVSEDNVSEDNAGDRGKTDEVPYGENGTPADGKHPMALLHARCLVKFLDETISAKKKHLESPDCEKVTFSDIWYLFQPGEEVVDQAKKQAYRVLRVSMPKHRPISPYRFRNSKSEDDEDEPATIHCVYIDFDGERLGPVTKEFKIPRFDQTKLINTLPIFPLRKVQEDGYREKLIERGKMLWDVVQVKPMYYKGYTIDTRQDVDSQVMIDFTEALAYSREHDKGWKPYVDFISTSTEESNSDDSSYRCEAVCCRGQHVFDDSFVEDKRSEEFITSLFPKFQTDNRSLIVYPQALRELIESKRQPDTDELVITSYRVFGFILRNRQWAQLDLTYLRGENEDSRTSALDAFSRLVLPAGHKSIVKSLVTQHFRDKRARERVADSKMDSDPSSDLIRGKGQGLIILLHGAPGVGKTTTAEGVAETFQKPLFQVTCGDLGTTAATVQTELEKNFTLASRWDCILLLDEAEVFLASRERKDLTRNGLVAVFLRVLEYYTGILFLTTNRVGDFDEAFASRIHMSLYYPKLDLEKTLGVFDLNMELIKRRFKLRGRQLLVDEPSIRRFAQDHFEANSHKQGLRWNGRQIRNACQTALAMAEFEQLASVTDVQQISSSVVDIEPTPFVHLKLDHFDTIRKAYDEFANYLVDIYTADFDERAAETKIRAEDADIKLLRTPQRSNDYKFDEHAAAARLHIQERGAGLAETPNSTNYHVVAR